MVRISEEKKRRIMEQILSLLYEEFPKPLFTVQIGRSIARDEEFIKAMMFELKNKDLVAAIKKNPKGIPYSRRIRWRLTKQTHKAYSELH